ncbi:MAG TPA: hypothetical protein VMM93_04875 [Vicinamibacterales bacterium]|nr:hypothetical protein [Vicinamibacterales bacterium]
MSRRLCAALLVLPIFVVLVPSMLPMVAAGAAQATAVPREAMTLLLTGPENLAARPFDLRVAATPPDFPVDVLPAGAAVQVSAGGDRVAAVVAALMRFASEDRSAFERRLQQAGWINPMQPMGFSAPAAQSRIVVCRGDLFAAVSFAQRGEGGTWVRASVVTDTARSCVARPQATASSVPVPALVPPAGARGGHASLGGTPEAMYSSVRLETRQSVAEVAAHYAGQLTAAGWTIEGRSSEAATMAVTRLRTSSATGERITGLLVVTSLDGFTQMDVLFRIVQPAVQ